MFGITLIKDQPNYAKVLKGRKKVIDLIYEDCEAQSYNQNKILEEVQGIINEYNIGMEALRTENDKLKDEIDNETGKTNAQIEKYKEIEQKKKECILKLKEDLSERNSFIQERNAYISKLPLVKSGEIDFYKMVTDVKSMCNISQKSRSMNACDAQLQVEKSLLSEDPRNYYYPTASISSFAMFAAWIVLAVWFSVFIGYFSSVSVLLAAMGLILAMVTDSIVSSLPHYELQADNTTPPSAEDNPTSETFKEVGISVVGINLDSFFNKNLDELGIDSLCVGSDEKTITVSPVKNG